MRSLALRVAVATAAVTLGVVTLSIFGAPAGASVWTPPSVPSTTAPFNECPAVGQDSGCQFLIILPASGPAQILTNPALGPYDGNDDTLVGILNETGVAIPSVALSSNTDIFNFDTDGVCTYSFTGNTGCPFGTTQYEGPGTSFSGYSSSNNFETGNVNFSGAGLATGSSTFFSLESSLSGANFTIPASFVVSKAASPTGGVIAGSSTPIDYTLAAHNVGGSAGTVTITDTVPTGTTLVANSAVCGTVPAGASCGTPVVNGTGAAGTTITWTVSNVPAGDTATVVFQVTANSGDATGTIPNTGYWSGPGCTTQAPGCPTNTTNTPVTAKIPVVITANDTTSTYGTAPSVTYTISGDSGGPPATLPTCVSTVTATTPVGSYPGTNTCSGASDPRYTISYVPGKATVNPATLTVTASSYSMVYGGPTQPITNQITGYVNGQNSSVLTTAPTCSAPVTDASPVGTYTSSCGGGVAPNYTFDYVNGAVTVTTHPLVITASSPQVIVGDTIPPVVPGYSGFVNGDTASSLTTPPTCTTTATATSAVGTYPTSCSGAVDPNYAITYVAGSLVITNGFSVTKSVSPTSGVVVGSSTPLKYTLTATNAGTATTQTPLVVSDTVPTGTTLVSGSPACATGGPPACSVALIGQTITWTIPAGVAPGTVYTLTFSVTVNTGDAAGTIGNTATWTGPGCVDGPCPTNTASTTVTAAPVTAPATTPTTAAPAAPTAAPAATPAAAPAAPKTTPAIAFTGARLTEEWVAGAVAILLGTGLVMLARRRRRRTA